jgi:hypothetical protein
MQIRKRYLASEHRIRTFSVTCEAFSRISCVPQFTIIKLLPREISNRRILTRFDERIEIHIRVSAWRGAPGTAEAEILALLQANARVGLHMSLPTKFINGDSRFSRTNQKCCSSPCFCSLAKLFRKFETFDGQVLNEGKDRQADRKFGWKKQRRKTGYCQTSEFLNKRRTIGPSI